MQTLKAILLIVTTICLSTTVALAQEKRSSPALRFFGGSCQEMFDDFVNYSHQPRSISGQQWIDFQLVMNTPNLKWSQYTVGKLNWSEHASPSGSLHGEGRQYFSDRIWAAPEYASPEGNPFNPAKTDKLDVYIEPPWKAKTNVTVTFTLLSWGNGKSTSTPQCANGVMYGFVGEAMYIFSFKKSGYQIR